MFRIAPYEISRREEHYIGPNSQRPFWFDNEENKCDCLWTHWQEGQGRKHGDRIRDFTIDNRGTKRERGERDGRLHIRM